MKTRTRFAAYATAALAPVASVWVAAPAFAHGDAVNPLSSAGQPVDVVAISIVGVVLLGFVLIGSTLLGNLFEKKNKK